MSGFEGDADFAVGLETADAGAMPGTWVNDHEGSTRGVDISIRWRNNPHKSIIDRAIERAAIKYQLDLEFENVRYCLGQMVTVLIAPRWRMTSQNNAAWRRPCNPLPVQTSPKMTQGRQSQR